MLDEEGWRYSTDTGWNEWDIQIYGNFWWSISLRTVTEYHGGPKCLTRVSLRNRFVATTVIINLAVLTLLIYHQLSTGKADLWVMLGYMGFLLFLRHTRTDAQVTRRRTGRSRCLSDWTPAAKRFRRCQREFHRASSRCPGSSRAGSSIARFVVLHSDET